MRHLARYFSQVKADALVDTLPDRVKKEKFGTLC